jgi:hypothetical protein
VSRRPPDIEVEIDELVLHGFPASQRRAIADAVQAELVTALAGWDPTGDHAARLDGGSFTVASTAQPTEVGRGVGGQVGRALRSAAPAGSDRWRQQRLAVKGPSAGERQAEAPPSATVRPGRQGDR